MSYLGTILADTPFSVYALNEASGTVANDSSGNAHNGTYTGTVTLGQAGLVAGGGTSCTFDGSTGYVACPSAGVPTGNAPYTQELWFIPNAFGALGVCVGWGVALANEEPVFYIDATGHLTISTWATDTTIVQLATATKYYVAVTYDGTTQRCYVNSVLSAITNTPGTVATPASPAFTIGANPSPIEFRASMTAGWAAGYASALTLGRIQAHYAAGISSGGGLLLRGVNV